ncbi:TPA: hypothetical protein ACWSQO_002365 [Klebsiella pneumoniae]|nr:hypothetical protein [Klebsiella pneumoniae]
MIKKPEGAFLEDDKEPVIERINELIQRYPSRSAAARAWGININTLKSYFRRGDSVPTPRENILVRIANNEGVGLDWLKAGAGLTRESPKPPETPTIPNQEKDRLQEMLSFLTPDERQQLTALLARKGVELVLYLLDERNIELLQSDDDVKHRALAMMRAKKGTSKTSKQIANPDLSNSSKKVV